MTNLPDGIYDQVDRAVAENNAAYGGDTSGAVVTATKTRYSPWMYSTQFTDRPNQNIVLVSYHIEYDISDIYWHGIPYPFSRTAGQSVDIEISCEGIYLVVNLPQMTEGQVYVPDAKAVLSSPVPPVNAQYSGKLVIIANMWQVPQNMEDSAFLAFDKASNWGAGTPIINTPKTWSYTNTRISRKPIYVRSNGYEVTLQIIGPPGSIYN
jgi:hypothetical protein